MYTVTVQSTLGTKQGRGKRWQDVASKVYNKAFRIPRAPLRFIASCQPHGPGQYLVRFGYWTSSDCIHYDPDVVVLVAP